MTALPKSTTKAPRAGQEQPEDNLLVLSINRGAKQAALERERLQATLGLDVVPLSTHDDFAALAKKHFEIGTRNSLLGRQLTEAVTAITRGIAAHRHRRVEEQAQAIVDGRTDDASVNFEELRSRVARLTEETRAHQEALRLVNGQMDEVRAERSIDVAAQAAPHHRQAATEIADALDALFAALKKEEQIRGIVTDAGYDDRLPNFQGTIPTSYGNHLARFAERVRGYIG